VSERLGVTKVGLMEKAPAEPFRHYGL
jgi:hypothetical protein